MKRQPTELWRGNHRSADQIELIVTTNARRPLRGQRTGRWRYGEDDLDVTEQAGDNTDRNGVRCRKIISAFSFTTRRQTSDANQIAPARPITPRAFYCQTRRKGTVTFQYLTWHLSLERNAPTMTVTMGCCLLGAVQG